MELSGEGRTVNADLGLDPTALRVSSGLDQGEGAGACAPGDQVLQDGGLMLNTRLGLGLEHAKPCCCCCCHDCDPGLECLELLEREAGDDFSDGGAVGEETGCLVQLLLESLPD